MTSSSTTEVATRPPSAAAAAWPFIGHLARIGFALVFLWAAVSKVVDPPLFSEQIAGYGLTPAAWSKHAAARRCGTHFMYRKQCLQISMRLAGRRQHAHPC